MLDAHSLVLSQPPPATPVSSLSALWPRIHEPWAAGANRQSGWNLFKNPFNRRWGGPVGGRQAPPKALSPHQTQRQEILGVPLCGGVGRQLPPPAPGGATSNGQLNFWAFHQCRHCQKFWERHFLFVHDVGTRVYRNLSNTNDLLHFVIFCWRIFKAVNYGNLI